MLFKSYIVYEDGTRWFPDSSSLDSKPLREYMDYMSRVLEEHRPLEGGIDAYVTEGEGWLHVFTLKIEYRGFGLAQEAGVYIHNIPTEQKNLPIGLARVDRSF